MEKEDCEKVCCDNYLKIDLSGTILEVSFKSIKKGTVESTDN